LKLYNLYIIRKIAGYFLVVLGVLILLIWFSKAISLIRFITEKGVSVGDFLSLFILIVPWLLMAIIPISLFIAVLFAYNQMLSHNEVIILENAGLDKFTLSKPAMFVASICCLICYFISFFLMPYANKKLRNIKTDFEYNYANLLISPATFENLKNLTIYVETRDSANKLSGILIYDDRSTEYSTTLTAKSGILNQEGNSILLYLNDGTAQRFNYKSNKSDILHFDSYIFSLNDDKQVNIIHEWSANERYLSELINPSKKLSEKDLVNYYVELHQRITYPLLSMVFTLIACAFILSGKFKRHGNLKHNITALFVTIIFMGFLMSGYSAMRKFTQLTPLIYIDILIFIIISFWMLKPKKLNGIDPQGKPYTHFRNKLRGIGLLGSTNARAHPLNRRLKQ